MAAAIGVRRDYASADLRRLARVILDGGSRSEAARVAGVTLQIVRDWVLRFNEGGPEGLATRKAPGKASTLNDEQRARLAEMVEAGPIPAAVMRGHPEGITPKELSEYLRVRSPTTIAALRTLEAKGLIARRRHSDDGRMTLYRLTKKGGEIERIVRASALAVEHRASASLSQEQIAAFREIVTVIRISLDAQLAEQV